MLIPILTFDKDFKIKSQQKCIISFNSKTKLQHSAIWKCNDLFPWTVCFVGFKNWRNIEFW